MAKGPTVKMRKRMAFFLSFICIVGFGGLICRLAKLQLFDGEYYQKLAAKQQMRVTTISPERGTIYDRNMKVLAQSATVWTVSISPVDIKSEEERELVADYLSELLEVDKDYILERSRKNTYYEIIKRKIERPLADQITKFKTDNKINCINLDEDNKRYYPFDNFAADVLGFTGSENQGAYGLEAYYNSILSGTPGQIVSVKNAKGEDMPYKYDKMYEAENGNSIVLTIDETVQHYVEKHLEAAVKENDVRQRAVGIAMDVKTGAILGMATKGDFDPNSPTEVTDPYLLATLEGLEGDEYKEALQQAQFIQWRNKAISDPYEPGSVFKILTASAAMEEGVVHQDDTFVCNGYHEVSGETIRCWKTGGHGTQNFLGALMHSCNPAFMTIGERLGVEKFYDYFELFGLTDITGVDLPGEANGIMHNRDSMTVLNLASSSMGQSFKVTPIQLLTAICGVLNDGQLMKPYIVSQILDENGSIVKTTEPQVVRQVVSKETSDTIALMCEQVVAGSGGSGRLAYRPGYRIGGKTGTSQKLDQNKNEEEKNVLSFLGFAPANDPQVAVLVLLDEPNLNNTYGSVIAAPVVGNILEDILPYLGVEPQYTEEELATMDVETPNMVNVSAYDAETQVGQKGLKARVVGDGDTVVSQIPAAGEPLPRGGTVILYTEQGAEQQMVEVPKVTGLSGQVANKTLLNSGLNIRIQGASIEGATVEAISQSPAAGEMVPQGTVVTVQFADKTVQE